MKNKIAKWYKQKLWSKAMVHDAVGKGIITESDYAEIVGEEYDDLEADRFADNIFKDFTEEEAKTYSGSLNGIYTDTGINISDVLK